MVLLPKQHSIDAFNESGFHHSFFFFSFDKRPPVFPGKKKEDKKTKRILGCLKLNTCFWYLKKNIRKKLFALVYVLNGFVTTYNKTFECMFTKIIVLLMLRLNIIHQNCNLQLILLVFIFSFRNKNINHFRHISIQQPKMILKK